MTPDKIEEYIEQQSRKDIPINIHFKDRNTVKGLFIKSSDYNDLKSKNLWRIVSTAHLSDWEKTKNENLARIFNGLSFTRLSDEI
ncbi:MAG: short-chain dehydrogenase [Bacteroidetes bacterium]|nr:short-chain dehydrogenase [Bacteroidota bacterium]MBS1930611.1 short-chain dehydrogenase [Bacteroidota bacterium]